MEETYQVCYKHLSGKGPNVVHLHEATHQFEGNPSNKENSMDAGGPAVP